MFNLKERFCFNADDGNTGNEGGQGGQETGQNDYGKMLTDPKFQEALLGSEFFKKNVQSAEDRLRTKHTGEKKTLEQMFEDLKKDNTELMAFKRENEKIAILKEMNVPMQFWDIIQSGEVEVVKAMATKLLSAHGDILKAQVEEKFKLGGGNPGGDAGGTKTTKEQFSKMTYAERIKIFEEDQALYAELNK